MYLWGDFLQIVTRPFSALAKIRTERRPVDGLLAFGIAGLLSTAVAEVAAIRPYRPPSLPVFLPPEAQDLETGYLTWLNDQRLRLPVYVFAGSVLLWIGAVALIHFLAGRLGGRGNLTGYMKMTGYLALIGVVALPFNLVDALARLAGVAAARQWVGSVTCRSVCSSGKTSSTSLPLGRITPSRRNGLRRRLWGRSAAALSSSSAWRFWLWGLPSSARGFRPARHRAQMKRALPPGKFPAGFLWGTATAAHQVEGDNRANDWWQWEQVQGHIRNGDRSGAACDHYRRFSTDFLTLKSLHQNAHRFSVEWSRIEPAPGQFSRDALDHYREVVQTLRALGMEPIVTLHHFTNPLWLVAGGGWTAPMAAERFAGYADRVVAELGDLVRFWITINEPTVLAYQGYIRGDWPPGQRHLGAAARALANLLSAHWLAFERIKQRSPASQVGLAHHLRVFDPARALSPLDRAVAWGYRRLFDQTVRRSLQAGHVVFPLDRVSTAHGPRPSQDFIGLNYYTRDLVRFNRHRRAELFGERVVAPGSVRSSLGWEVYPQGLYRTLRELAREHLPIYITENGIADSEDRLRPTYLVEHLRAALQAIEDGVPLRGYLHWTSFDNFEWAEGYSAKFGLIACDRQTQERTLKESARFYAEICRTGVLPPVIASAPETQQTPGHGRPPDPR